MSVNDSGFMKKLTRGVFSRLDKAVAMNTEIIALGITDNNVYRDPQLEQLDAYYENRQFDKLAPFDRDEDASGAPIPLRQRQPRIKVPYARNLSSIVTSKLIGPTVFPSFRTPGFPDDQAYWKMIVDVSKIQLRLLEPMRRMVNTGEVFVRFWIAGGQFMMKHYDSKFCYPSFDEAGELDMMRIQYVFTDMADRDNNGSPKKKWVRIDLGSQSEVVYDNPEYRENVTPEFQPVSETIHGFGFVQGEWITTTGAEQGYGLTKDIMAFIDELCYSLSQSSKSVSYNQDPQLMFKGMSSDEMDDLVRSATKSWNLGLKGEAEFKEAGLQGVQVAMELRDKVRQNIADISRVVLLDPEKIVGSAQSGRAMEILHGPLKDLIDELRLPVGDALKKLVLKMGAANFIAFQQNIVEVPIPIPEGFHLNTLNPELKWPAIFQQTLEDLQKKVQLTSQAITSGLISRVTAVKHVAEDFGIEDLEQELKLIAEDQAAMAALNPFGGF